MIRGIHGLFYSSDAEATRTFFKEKVQLPGSDVGEGWWIFDFAEGDLGIHPTESAEGGGKHDISFYCDDIQGTVADLASRGVEFRGEIEDHGYGLVTYFTAPGGITVQLYEPRYVKGGGRAKAAASRRARKATPKRATQGATTKHSRAKVSAKKTPVKRSAKAATKTGRKAGVKTAPKKGATKKGATKTQARKPGTKTSVR